MARYFKLPGAACINTYLGGFGGPHRVTKGVQRQGKGKKKRKRKGKIKKKGKGTGRKKVEREIHMMRWLHSRTSRLSSEENFRDAKLKGRGSILLQLCSRVPKLMAY